MKVDKKLNKKHIKIQRIQSSFKKYAYREGKMKKIKLEKSSMLNFTANYM